VLHSSRILFPLFATYVVDTVGKFAADVVEIGGNYFCLPSNVMKLTATVTLGSGQFKFNKAAAKFFFLSKHFILRAATKKNILVNFPLISQLY
jgi:hypothetical protein